MKISIAMATYNGEQYIKEQLQSFVTQTCLPDEVIISDDCSTDDTESIVREFEKVAPFTVAFHRNEKNLGYCGNFNAALMKATGDLIFLSDQDDVWFPEKIEHMVRLAIRNPEALVLMNDAALTDGQLNEVGLTKLGQIRSAGFNVENFVMGCCCAIRRELLDFCMPIPPGVKGHDNWLVQFADGLHSKVVDSTVLQYYRRHECNESQFIVNQTKRVTRIHALVDVLKPLFKENSVLIRQRDLQQFQIFLDGICRAEQVVPSVYKAQLESMKDVYQRKVITSKRRLYIINKPLILRVLYIAGMFVGGGYRNASGIRSAIKDIVG